MSSYSLLQSTINIDDYIRVGKLMGYESLALTDKGILHGVVEFYEKCRKEGIKPIIGCQFDFPGLVLKDLSYSFIVYAKNYQGYLCLMELSTIYQTDKTIQSMYQLMQENKDHIKILLLSDHSEIKSLYRSHNSLDFKLFLDKVKETFGLIEIALAVSLDTLEENAYQDYISLIQSSSIKPISHQATYYLRTNDDYSWRVLNAIEENLQIEAHQADVSGPHYLHESNTILKQFKQLNQEDLISNQMAFVEDLSVEILLHQSLLPKYQTPKHEEAHDYLRSRCFIGLTTRGVEDKPDYIERMNYELDVIHQMGFDDYFLIVWDVMAYAADHDIQIGPGRGSAAGSLVSYLLGITQVDPIKYDLLFERFLNPERYTMPDIDLDFPDNKRDDLLMYVANKYGAKKVAQIATFGTLAAKQAIRDVGRVMGLDTPSASRWSKAIPNTLGIKLEDAFKQSSPLRDLVNRSPRNQLLFETAKRIEGLPRHMSTHAAGVVISQENLINYVPLMNRDLDLLTTQYSMGVVEQIGLLKMDFLGLRNLTILNDILQFIKKTRQEEIDIYQIPLDDEKTFAIFQAAKTNGIFQFESSGIRQVLKRLEPNSLEDLAAVNALYRPGPMEQIDTFIKRKKGKEKIRYPHDDLESILKNTYGVMVYQEQVMQVTNRLAGFTLGQADILRRAMGKKDKKVIDEKKVDFVKGAQNKGYSKETAIEVYNYIERFANYGFNRSHSFAYSLLGYQLAYLKANFTSEFFAGLLKSTNPQSSKAQDYLMEAKENGIAILAPSIQESGSIYTIQDQGIITGLSSIKGLRKDFIALIIENRYQYGAYKDFLDFAYRIGKKYSKVENFEALIYSGALDCFGQTRASLLASIPGIISGVSIHGNNLSLDLNDELLPKLEIRPELPLLLRLEKEEEYLGYAVSGHPSEEFKEQYQQKLLKPIHGVYERQKVEMIGILKNVKKIRTKKGDPMAFATLQDYSGSIDVTLFPENYVKSHQLFNENEFVYISGKIEPNRSGGFQLQVNLLKSIETYRKDLENINKKCYLRIKEDFQNSDTYQRIEKIVSENKGSIPVYLYVESTKKLVRANFKQGIDGSKLSIYQLEQLLGNGSVKIIE